MKATIKLYKISRCGVYKQNSQLPVFLGISELLQELSTWAIGKTLSETDIFRNPNNEGFCTYLADIRSYKYSYLLVMWNQVPYTNAGVLSLPNTSKVGSIKKADTNAVKDNSIPGYPTFFWFLPKQNTFATICFNTTTNGRYDMEQYLKQFMRTYSSHVVKSIDKSQKGVAIEGYSNNPNDSEQPIYKKHPVFLSRPYPLSTNIENIAKKAYKIKKITKKATAKYNNEVTKAFFQKALEFFQLIKPKANSADVFSVKTEVSTPNGLTSKDVMDLYAEWSSDVNSVHTLDYGFTLDGKNLWFSHTIAKWEGEISLSFTEQDSFGNMEKLIVELENKKRSILSII